MPKDKAMQTEPVAPERMPPSISLSEEDLPEIKDWSVGKTYRFVLEVKQVSSSINEYSKDKKMEARFSILKAKALNGNEDTQDFSEFEKSYKGK